MRHRTAICCLALAWAAACEPGHDAPDGAVREVRFPDRFDAIRFRGSRVWGVQRDELDVASVAWIELPPTS